MFKRVIVKTIGINQSEQVPWYAPMIQFEGMTNIEFSYEEYEDTREHLIKTIKQCIQKMTNSFCLV